MYPYCSPFGGHGQSDACPAPCTTARWSMLRPRRRERSDRVAVSASRGSSRRLCNAAERCLETRTRLNTSMPASRNASSKLWSLLRCLPTPLVEEKLPWVQTVRPRECPSQVGETRKHKTGMFQNAAAGIRRTNPSQRQVTQGGSSPAHGNQSTSPNPRPSTLLIGVSWPGGLAPLRANGYDTPMAHGSEVPP